MNGIRHILFLLVVLSCGRSYAAVYDCEPVILYDSLHEYHLTKDDMLILADTTGTLPFSRILSPHFQKQFIHSDLIYKGIHSPGTAYWIKFCVRDQSVSDKKWLFQAPLHSQRIEVYIPEPDGTFREILTGQGYGFVSREYLIRAQTFDLPASKDAVQEFYVRIQSKAFIDFSILISEQRWYTEILVGGYYFLGIIYGFLLLMAIYNLILFFSTRERTYLLYVCYVLCSMFFLTWKDGLGFQYIWPGLPELNFYHHRVGLFLLTFSFVVYSVDFLELKKTHRKLFYFCRVLAVALVVQFVLILFNPTYFNPFPYLYLLAFLSLVVITTYLLAKGFKPARYFIFGLVAIVIGLTVIKLRYLALMEWSWFAEYVLNYSMVVEVIAMSVAMGDKLTIIKKEQERSQNLLIRQLEENERLKDKVNKELEEKVNERTTQLHEKMGELNEVNEKLKMALDELKRMNVELDLSNWTLKKSIKQERQLRIVDKAVKFESFLEIFPDEFSCLRFLQERKWGEEGAHYQCLRCKNKKFVAGNQPCSKKCSRCNYIETATANTLFHGVKFPLNKAFYIAYIVVRDERATSVSLSHELDLRKNTCLKFRNKVLDKKDFYLQKHKASDLKDWEKLILYK